MIIKLPLLPFDLNIHRLQKNFQPTPPASQPQTTILERNYDKVFCIGSGKTGTTSLEKLLRQFGFSLGNQPVAEVLSRDWLERKDPDRIIRFCHTAEAFQDAPFGYSGLHKVLDEAFPNAKFILTVRSSPEEWFDSLVRFHTKLFSSNPNRPPDENDLKNTLYRYKGFLYESYMLNYGKYGIKPYDSECYKNQYESNNNEKREYFKDRPNDFLEINLANPNDFPKLCHFLNIETTIPCFPWENRTKPQL